MSQISLKSISGITSITTPTGADNQFTLHTNNTNEALKLDGAGNLHFHNHLNITGVTTITQDLDVDGHTNLDNVSIAGVTTTGNLSGSNANFTGELTVAEMVGHTGDTHTKLSFPANDTIAFTTGGTERVRIDSSGRVLIGTTTEGAANADELTISYNNTGVGGGDQGRCGITIRSGDNTSGVTQNGYIYFSDGTSGDNEYRGVVAYSHSDDSMYFSTAAAERLRIRSGGEVAIGGAGYSGQPFSVQTSSTNLGYMQSTGTTRAVMAFVDANSSVNVGYGCIGNNHVFMKDASEKMRIDSSGRLLINNTSADGDNKIQIYGNSDDMVQLRMKRTNAIGSNSIYGGLDIVDNNNNDVASITAHNEGGTTAAYIAFKTYASGALGERLRIISNGRIGINTTSATSALQIYAADLGEGTAKGQIFLKDNADYNATPTGGIVFQGHHTSGKTSQAIFAGIRGFKANTGDGDYDGCLGFDVRKHGAVAYEAMRINEYGTITNTTDSSHSQGAGTFNIKGVINQYSQGSGSGLIFDCDFGRLTGYDDDNNVNNGTNLSSCLSHSTTDWTSSSSNTPMTVNGGTLQYRSGFGGYMEGISNGGRVSVAAGSGSPNMASTLNTASMTIETWCWYDGDGREVIVSRFGSGFPNQFNMLCDPNGQFHFNNSGVGCGSGNISGEHFPDKTWHHHVWQYDSGSGTLNRWYINGAFANSYDAGSSLAVSSNTGFGIFSRADRLEDFRGKIAVVRIYNRALSATEIKNHFELDRGRFGV